MSFEHSKLSFGIFRMVFFLFFGSPSETVITDEKKGFDLRNLTLIQTSLQQVKNIKNTQQLNVRSSYRLNDNE